MTDHQIVQTVPNNAVTAAAFPFPNQGDVVGLKSSVSLKLEDRMVVSEDANQGIAAIVIERISIQEIQDFNADSVKKVGGSGGEWNLRKIVSGIEYLHSTISPKQDANSLMGLRKLVSRS